MGGIAREGGLTCGGGSPRSHAALGGAGSAARGPRSGLAGRYARQKTPAPDARGLESEGRQARRREGERLCALARERHGASAARRTC